jgi:hypothetical protein
MKSTAALLVSFVFLFLSSAFPSLASAGVRLQLKTGGEITADTCRESAGKFICSKLGGLFEIEKKDVVSIDKDSKGPDQAEKPDERSETAARQNKKPGGGVEENSNGGKVNEKTAAEKRLGEIQQRKSELAKESAALAQERESLKGQIKNAPDWMPENQYNDLQKKVSDFDARLKKFNEEAKQLNQEEHDLSSEMRAKTAESQTAP